MYAMNLVISCLFFLQFYSKIQLTVRFVLEHTVRGLAMPLAASNEITIFLGCAANYKHETKRPFLTLSFVTAKEFLFPAKSYEKASFTFVLKS